MKLFLTRCYLTMVLIVCLMLSPVTSPCKASQDVFDPTLLDSAALKALEGASQTEKKPIVGSKPVRRTEDSLESREQTQKDWMVSLVDACGWSFGLPDDPRTEDYVTILSGTRLLRIEAEEAKQKLDSVSVKNFRTYGRFSGSGWVSGIASPTKIHMKFLVPLSGEYRLTANLHLAGFRFHIGEQELTADGGRGFRRVELGMVELMAGPQEIIVDIPPNASIDYIDLEGGHARRIAPPGGWQVDEPLTFGVIASTAFQVLSLEHLLPLSDDEISVEAEVVGDTDHAKIITDRHLGVPSGGKWLRVGAGATRVELPLAIEREGFYSVSLRAAASRPVKVTINGRFEKTLNFPSYLDSRSVGTFRLTPGNNRVSVELPPRAGIDLITIRRRSDTEQVYRRLAGVSNDEESLTRIANDVLQVLATIGMPR